jgi:hypothetical protein
MIGLHKDDVNALFRKDEPLSSDNQWWLRPQQSDCVQPGIRSLQAEPSTDRLGYERGRNIYSIEEMRNLRYGEKE